MPSKYVAALGKILAPHGRLYLQCFSDQEPEGDGPRRISKEELDDAFANGWRIVAVHPTRFTVREDTDLTFSNGGPKAWFCVMERGSEETDA